jgi:hypothetical protein
MTLEEKNETLRDLGECIQLAKRYFDNGNDMFSVSSGHWTVAFDGQYENKKEAMNED